VTEQTIVDLASKSVYLAMLVAAPALFAAMGMGLIISIMQAATQINEQTLSFIPKIAAMLVTMIIAGPWILQKLMIFTIDIFRTIEGIGR
jgi:flagellar biosynthesis protein FliQ